MDSNRPRRPYVSIVIPCLDEELAIAGCLRSILAQTYPRERTEIILADGGSRDATLGIVDEICRLYPLARIRVVSNPERLQAAGCNRAICASRGEVIVRMDAHAQYQADYIEACVDALQSTGADVVGGAARPAYRTVFQRAVALALLSPMGVGGAKYRRAECEGWVETIWNGAFRRSVFTSAGLFDPHAATNEDAELSLRITRAGGRIWLSRSIVSFYFPRRSLPALARQYFRYGMGRARTTLAHGALQTWRPLAPFALVVGLVILAALGPAWRFGAWPFAAALAAYLVAVAAEALRLAMSRAPRLFPLIVAIFPAIHFAHGVGFALGLLRYARRPDWTDAPLRLARQGYRAPR